MPIILKKMGGVETDNKNNNYGFDSNFTIKCALFEWILNKEYIAILDKPLYTWVRHYGQITRSKSKMFDFACNELRKKIICNYDEILLANTEEEIKRALNIKIIFNNKTYWML